MKRLVPLLVVVSLVYVVCAYEVPLDCDYIPYLPWDYSGNRVVYDFVVIGAGATGSIVASRIAQETNKYVLLLEGGAQGTGQRDIGGTDVVASDFETDPKTGKQTLGKGLTRYDVVQMADSARIGSDVLNNMWNITGIGFFYQQAKVVGGNQAVNGAQWLVTQKKDMDAWKLPGWSSTDLWPKFKKMENASSTCSRFGCNDRGLSGPMNIEIPSFLPRDQSMFVDAAKKAGYTDGGDMSNGAIKEAYYYVQSSTRKGIRESSSVSYLSKALNRTNLSFRTGAVVTRILFDANNTAIGVEYADKTGAKIKVYAQKEVVIAAGCLQSAKILFNSGIGPKSILQAFGKPKRVINEIIGQKVRNHQDAHVVYSDPSFVLPNFYTVAAASVQYARNGTGIFNKQNIALNVKINPNAPYPEVMILVFVGGTYPTDPYGQYVQISVYLNIQIYANGTLNLTDTDPLGGTVFKSNALVVREDAVMIAKGILKAREIMRYWNGSAKEIAPGLNYTNINDLADWVQANPFTSCHLYSSIPMGTASTAPADPRGMIRGVNRLRVVGPAAVPGSVFVGMQALANAMGEHSTDHIKQDHGL